MANHHNILGIITARGGSKGIPGKNIKLLGGKPLLAYTIEVAKQSKLLTRTILSTDDEKIAAVGREWGAEVPFLRPSQLAQDGTLHLPVVQHAVNFMEKKLGEKFTHLVILQPTSPFRTVEDLDGTIKLLLETGADSAVSVVEVKGDHPIKAKRLVGNQILPYFMPESEGIRRQDLPKAYKRSGAVYALRRDLAMMDGRFYGDKVVGYEVPRERSIDIDDELDWVQAEYMWKKIKTNTIDENLKYHR
jgi:CMP-N-acetylneuraminic acid synthetase